METGACILAEFAGFLFSSPSIDKTSIDKLLDQLCTPGQVRANQSVTETSLDKDTAIRRKSSGQAEVTIPTDNHFPRSPP